MWVQDKEPQEFMSCCKDFLDISLGSSFELLTQLHIAKHRNYINQEQFNQLENKIEAFQRLTMAFQINLK